MDLKHNFLLIPLFVGIFAVSSQILVVGHNYAEAVADQSVKADIKNAGEMTCLDKKVKPHETKKVKIDQFKFDAKKVSGGKMTGTMVLTAGSQSLEAKIDGGTINPPEYPKGTFLLKTIVPKETVLGPCTFVAEKPGDIRGGCGTNEEIGYSSTTYGDTELQTKGKVECSPPLGK